MKYLRSTLAVLVLISSTLMMAGEEDKSDAVATIVKQKLPSIEIDYIAPSPFPGLYEVFASGQLIYVSEDGNFLFNGGLFDISNGIVNLSEKTRSRIDSLKNPFRKEKIDAVPQEQMIVFAADNEKYRISVFTDVDCGYCRQLHREMSSYNKLGISVQYLGYPRAGIGSPSHAKLRSIWCADDRKAAMDMGKLKREFGSDTCEDPLVEHMQLVKSFGITGTPAIIFPSGKLIPGYINAARLVQMIEEDQAQATETTPSGESSTGS